MREVRALVTGDLMLDHYIWSRALAVQVHPADLIGQAVDQPGQLFGIAAKDAELLTVVRGHHIVQRFLQVVEDRNRHQGPELLIFSKYFSSFCFM